MRKFWNWKKIALLTAFSVTLGSVVNVFPSEAGNSALPEELTLPITLIDYNADNLLFEYDLYDSIGTNFAFTSSNFVNALSSVGVSRVTIPEHGEGIYYTMGLVEDELVNGLPVYKKEVVEQVAKLVQGQMAAPSNNDTTALFADLRTKLVRQDADAINVSEITNDAGYRLTGVKQYFYNREGYSWTVSGGDYSMQDGKITRNVDGVEQTIWEHVGDGIKYLGNGNPDDTLSLHLGGLHADTSYKIARYKEGDGGLELSVSGGDWIVTPANGGGWRDTPDFTGVTDVTLSIVPTADSVNGRIAAVKLVEPGGETPIVTNVQNLISFTNSGWTVEGDGSYYYSNAAAYDAATDKMVWQFSGDGLVGYITDAVACTNLELNANRQYIVTYLGGSGMSVSVYDGATLLAEGLKNGDMFQVGANGNVKLVVKSSNQIEDGEGDWTRDKMVKLSLKEINCPLGNYEESKTKFADATKGYADISTCMDYAYYMLNRMFLAQTDTQVKTPYTDYESITLSQIQTGKDNYEFRADVSGIPVSDGGSDTATKVLEERYKIIYDKTQKNIRNDRTVVGTDNGLFPLDEATTMQNGYYGVTDEEGNRTEHNFHYALKSHAEFHYDETSDLYFTFLGDDDVYLFINGKLTLDIGGGHLAATKTIHLNDLKEELGLESGNTYQFDFFYLERHTEFSNFYIETNIQLLDAGELELNFYQDGNMLASGSQVIKGSTVELEYVLASYVDDMKNIAFADDSLGIRVGVNGLSYGDKIKLSPDGVKITVYRADGSEKEVKTFKTSEEVRDYFENLHLNRGEKVAVRGLLYTVDDKLEAEVTVSYDTPRYAGANNNYVTNVSTNVGTVEAVDTPNEPQTPTTPDNPQTPTTPNDNNQGSSGNNGNQGNNNAPQSTPQPTMAVSAPKTGDVLQVGNILFAGFMGLVGVELCLIVYRRMRKQGK